IPVVGERENRRRVVHQRRELVQIAAARGGEQAFAGARDRRGQAGEIGDDFGSGGRRGEGGPDLGGALLGWLGRGPRGAARGGVRRLLGATTRTPATGASNKRLRQMRSSMGRGPIEDRRQSIRSTESVASGRSASRAANCGETAFASAAPVPRRAATSAAWRL